MHAANIIELHNVFTVYEGERTPAIRNINVEVSSGEFLYVVGPNAAGKTTLIETINGLLSPVRGEVCALGLDMSKRGRKVRREIGYVPQDFMVNPGEPFRSLDVVLMGRFGKIGVLRPPSERDRERALDAMRLLGVESLANRPIGKLSGGQQQKVVIARAIAKEPKILLLDEPFSNLDPSSRREVQKLVAHLHDERDITTLVVSHDVSQVSKECNRMMLMQDGEIVANGAPEEILLLFMPWRR